MSISAKFNHWVVFSSTGRLFTALALCASLTVDSTLQANPANPSLRSGVATFSTSGSTSIIHQGSENVIIHWDTFSIQQGETTRFIQPGSTSAALNRVTSGNPSEIYGNLQANGRVLLINPNGILVGPGGRIDTAGFLGSTLDVSDSDFLNGGDMIFSGNSSAKVVNLGTINAIDGGNIFLIAQEVENYGTLNAPGGTVGLAGGTRVMVKSEAMGERISILPESKGGNVTNGTSGTITAAVAELKAAGGNEYALAINNDGLVRATRFENRGGKIYLGSGGGSRVRNRGTLRAPNVKINATTGTVENAGTIDASSELGNGGEIEIEAESVIGKVGGFLNTTGLNKGGTIKITASGELRLDDSISAVGENGFGGSIRLTGDTVTLGDTAAIDASGATGGGSILVGGGRAGRDDSISNARITTIEEGASLSANTTGSAGDGGTVILWADDTMDFRGSVQNRGAGSGAGGFTEVSGLRSLGFHGTVDTGGGDLLLDPFNYVIGATEATNLVNALGMNNVTIDTTTDGGAFGSSGNALDVGDITVNSEILYDSENDLTFLAVGDVNFNASVQNRNGSVDAGDVNIVAGWDGTTAYDTATFSAVDVNAVNPTLFGNASGGSTGSVFIGDGTQTAGIAVGSRRGTTNVFAYDVKLQGANADAPAGISYFSQLGFQISDGIALGSYNLRPMGDDDGSNVVVDGGITIHSRNDLSATGGGGMNNYVQVGHVGFDPKTSFGGEIEADASAVIEVSTGNDIRFSGGDGPRAFAQLGQGGTSARGDHEGTITITTANDIVFMGGNGDNTYAQLGQGGENARGNHSGTITITEANNIRFTGGNDYYAYAQLGQGGYGAAGNHSGTTTITEAGAITFTGGGADYAYAQLGQGGLGADGDHSGVTAITGAGDITFTGGGNVAYAQLGQGGYNAEGDHSGTTTIMTANDIVFTGGGGTQAYAQLGQGGYDAEGDHSGSIDVFHSGDLTLTGNNIDDRYALIGHGDAPVFLDILNGIVPDSDAGQSVSGLVTVNTGGDIDVNNGFIGHLLDADGDSNTGDILITAGGDITLNNHLERGSYDSPDDYTLLAEGDIHFNTSLQNRNATGGDINIVAGWDGTTAYDTAAFSAVDVNAAMPSLFGNQNGTSTGSVFIGDGTQTAGIAVGSRRGTTNVFAYDVKLQGANADAPAGISYFSQLGFQISDGIALGSYNLRPMGDDDGSNVVVDGGITIHSRNDLSATGGGGMNNYVQVGHVGFDPKTSFGGEIEADASAVIEVSTGNDIRFSGGDGPRAFAQLGQGGTSARGDHEGTITITTANDIVFMGGNGDNTYAQLGQGGENARGNHSGTITITEANNIRFTGGNDYYAYAQLGQGGYGAAGNHSGTTTITEAGAITFTGGGADYAYAQLGQGGLGADGDHSGVTAITGAGDITFTGGGNVAYAQLGQGGYNAEGDHSGTTTIMTANDIVFTGGGGTQAYAQLGQGGYDAEGDHSGSIDVFHSGDLTLTGNNIDDRYALIGHGDAPVFLDILNGIVPDSDAGQSVSGLVTVNTGGDIDVNNGFIGHLLDADGDSNTGDILITAGGDITLNNHLERGSYDSPDDYTLLAEGDIHFNTSLQNRNATGGDINIVAGWDGTTAYDTATFAAVDVNATNSTLFGNGNGSVIVGDGTQTAGIAVGSRSGTTNVFGHDVVLQGANADAPIGDSNFSQLGFRISDGIALGNNDLRTAGDTAGENVVVDGDITVHVRNDLTATGGGINNFAQVGHVGYDLVTGGAGEGIEAVASAVIEVAAGNDITFSGGGGLLAYAQLGQGGRFAFGDHSGTTTITTANDITFSGGTGGLAYAQLGQGGHAANGDHSGTTTIITANDIIFSAGTGGVAYAQLGQGGSQNANGDHSGTTTITTANDITFSGGEGDYAYAQLGQGGNLVYGNHSGTTTIITANDIIFSAG
ncbi:MAG: filamentous hemagglutinin N-terminal domain-containing protein, partial [Verrucomicrobiales bacterium]|nr:filamentous hemagglutinin N-terminal domain-containing protein [Verrucomicrobiales bacterium]